MWIKSLMGCESTKQNALVIEEKVWWDVNISNKMSGYCPTFTDAAREVKVKANTANFKSELLYYLCVRLDLLKLRCVCNKLRFCFLFSFLFSRVLDGCDYCLCTVHWTITVNIDFSILNSPFIYCSQTHMRWNFIRFLQ